MSIKGMGIDLNDMKVPTEDPSLRISMANLSLRDDFQNGDHVSRRYPDSVRGQTNELTGDHLTIPKHSSWMILENLNRKRKTITSVHSR